jgi:hypothetical protein
LNAEDEKVEEKIDSYLIFLEKELVKHVRDVVMHESLIELGDWTCLG